MLWKLRLKWVPGRLRMMYIVRRSLLWVVASKSSLRAISSRLIPSWMVTCCMLGVICLVHHCRVAPSIKSFCHLSILSRRVSYGSVSCVYSSKFMGMLILVPIGQVVLLEGDSGCQSHVARWVSGLSRLWELMYLGLSWWNRVDHRWRGMVVCFHVHGFGLFT